MTKTYLLPVLRLLWLQNKQSVMRLRYDVGRELVVIISSATLLGLFYYMFYDFLHAKLSDVDAALRAQLSRQFLVLLLLLLGPWTAGHLRPLWQKGAGWIAFAGRSGERNGVIQSFRLLQSLLILGSVYGFYFGLIAPRFTFEGGLELWTLVSLALAGVRLAFLNPPDPSEGGGTGQRLKPILSDAEQGRMSTLFFWRWHQLIRRNRMARLCLALSSLFAGLGALMLALAWPFFLLVLVCMAASLFLASALAFQLEEDMRSAWFERQIGCSHQEFVAVYQRLCYGIGLAFGIMMLLAVSILRDSAGISWTEAWKILPIAALFPCLLPAVMFQLAPDRPLLQILVTALIGLFIATAIYAHGAALVLVPLVIYYAMQYQQDNFYRT